MHAGLSRRQLSRMTGFEIKYLGRVERDAVSPPWTHLKKLAALLGTGILDWDGDPRPESERPKEDGKAKDTHRQAPVR
jgi:transcriptional regulator with XRE-family HTH domain